MEHSQWETILLTHTAHPSTHHQLSFISFYCSLYVFIYLFISFIILAMKQQFASILQV